MKNWKTANTDLPVKPAKPEILSCINAKTVPMPVNLKSAPKALSVNKIPVPKHTVSPVVPRNTKIIVPLRLPIAKNSATP